MQWELCKLKWLLIGGGLVLNLTLISLLIRFLNFISALLLGYSFAEGKPLETISVA